MEWDGVIVRDPQATWNSPLVIVKKKDGSIRICNNFIQLNKRTIPVPYIMTNTLELLNRVAGATYLTRLDLKKAYFQVKVHPQSQKYTSFQSPFGTWRYAKMPMGLINAGSTLQRIMDVVLRGAHDYADKLLDDIIVWTNNFESNLARLTDVLNRLRSAGLTLNTNKCHLATDRIRIFGFQVDKGLITPDAEKTKAIADWPVPRTKKQLSSFGIAGYYRGHISKFAEIVLPLTQLLAKHKPDKLEWGESQQRAFEKLKNALTSKPVLRPPDMTRDFENGQIAQKLLFLRY